MSFRPKVFIFFIILSTLFIVVDVQLAMAENGTGMRKCDDAGFIVGTKCKCPPDNDPRIAVICGEVRSTYIQEDEVSKTRKRIALPNVTVAVYEPYTKTDTNKDGGKLTNLYSSTYTDSNGNFTIFARKYREGDPYSYLVFRCGSKTDAKHAIGVRHDVYDLSIASACTTDITYEEPPTLLKDLVKTTKPLACYVDESNYNLVNSKEVKDRAKWTTEIPVGEKNYDIRFGGFNIKFLPDNLFPDGFFTLTQEGAWWKEDCAVRAENDQERALCYMSESPTDTNHPLYEEIITRNALPFIPTHTEVKAYRTFESRVSFTGKETQPDAFAKYSKTMLGDYVGNVYRVSHGKTMDNDALVSCDTLRDSGSILSTDGGVLNSTTSGGPAMHLSTPFLWENISEEVNIDTTRQVCMDENNVPVTLGELPPICGDCEVGTAGCPCRYNRDELSFRPELLFDAKEVTETWSTEGVGDSYASSLVRGDMFYAVDNEGANPYNKKSINVYPKGGVNANNAPTTALEISGEIRSDIQDVAGGKLTNVISTPVFNPDEEPKKVKTNSVYTIGTKVRELCSIPGEEETDVIPVTDPETESELEIDNVFTGATPRHGQLSLTGGTYTIGTDQAFNRDAALVSRAGRDAFDSILRLQSGTGKVNLSGAQLVVQTLYNLIFIEDNPQKSMGDRSSVLNAMTPTVKNDLTATFSISDETFEEEFPLPDYPYDTDNWGGGIRGVYDWHPLPNGQSCGTAPVPNNSLSRTCRVETCGRYNNSVMNCNCKSGIVEGCDDPTPIDECEPYERLACAQSQTTTRNLSGDTPVEGETTCECPSGSNDPTNCGISYTISGYECVVARAGPMEEYGRLTTTMSTRLRQETLTDDGALAQEEVASDGMSDTYNDLVKSLSSPYVIGDVLPPKYQNMGFINFRSSNTLDENNKFKPSASDRKDMVTAGVDPMPLMSVAADPVSFGADLDYPEVTFHCSSPFSPGATFPRTNEDCALKDPIEIGEPSEGLTCWGAEEDEAAQNCSTGDADIGNAKGLDDALAALSGTYMNPGSPLSDLNVANFEMCYCALARRAEKFGFDPAFTVAAWVEESGASNYEKFPGVEDLGIHGGGVPVENLEEQFNNFSGLESFYVASSLFETCRSTSPEPGLLTVLKFLHIYSTGGNEVPCDQPLQAPFGEQIPTFYQAMHADNSPLNYNKQLSGWDTFD